MRTTQELMVDDIAVRITRKNMKSLRMRVRSADGPVEVSAPAWASNASIGEFVRSRSTWIAQQRATEASSTMSRADRASENEIAQWKAVVQASVPVLLEHWEPIIGVHASKLAYRNMTSRWGSCQPSTGRVCINVRLALYPPECLEYVVVHELCHFLEPGHGRPFKALMDTYLPDWRTRKAHLAR